MKKWSDDLVIEYYNMHCHHMNTALAAHRIGALSGRKYVEILSLLKLVY
jgi:hypothetical protein